MRMKIHQLKKLDKMRDYTDHALIDRKVNSTDKKGQYIVKNVSDVIDFEKIEKEILNEKDDEVFNKLINIANNLKTFRKEVNSD